MRVETAVAEWAERFPREAPSTTANNASQAKHFAEMFPNRELDSVTLAEFERFAQVHPGAARYARTLLNDYRDAGVLKENVSDGVRIPRIPKKKVVVPTVEEVKRLIAAAEHLKRTGPRIGLMGPMIEVAAYTGLREGEQRALSIVDVRARGEYEDIIEAEVEYSIDRGERLKSPKTKSSQDTFTFLGRSPRTMRVLIDAPHPLHGRGWGAHTQTPVRDGRFFPFTRAERQAMWDKIRYQAGIGVTWHSLRHFCATWLLDNDKAIDDVALQLRCSVDEIRDTYGHPNRKAALARLREGGNA